MAIITDADKVKWFDESITWVGQMEDPIDIDAYNYTEVSKTFYIEFLKQWAKENNKQLPQWM